MREKGRASYQHTFIIVSEEVYLQMLEAAKIELSADLHTAELLSGISSTFCFVVVVLLF